MKTIALSGWLAYAPFRIAREELKALGVEVLDTVPDREDGLADGRYAAAPLSTYSFAAEFERLGPDFGVHSACVEPVGYGSDRIVARSGIRSAKELHNARIGLRSQGLEINLFEHFFDFAGFPRKSDYVFLEDRSKYVSAFKSRFVDAVMAPQPDRSKLLKQTSDAELFEGDKALPRYGLYAILVYNRAKMDGELLSQVHNVVSAKSKALSTLSNSQLSEADPASFDSIELPAAEIRTTLKWPSPNESYSYLHGTGHESFKSHLRQTIEFRSRRFGGPNANLERIETCVN